MRVSLCSVAPMPRSLFRSTLLLLLLLLLCIIGLPFRASLSMHTAAAAAAVLVGTSTYKNYHYLTENNSPFCLLLTSENDKPKQWMQVCLVCRSWRSAAEEDGIWRFWWSRRFVEDPPPNRGRACGGHLKRLHRCDPTGALLVVHTNTFHLQQYIHSLFYS